MRLPFNHQIQAFKRMLPRSLLGRSLLIMLIPLLVVQGVALQIFYGSHLEIVSRRFSGAIAGEIATTIDQMQRYPAAADRGWALDSAWDRLELSMVFSPGAILSNTDDQARQETQGGLGAALAERVRKPFQLDWQSDPRSVLIRVQMADGVLDVQAPRKRLYAGTIYLFVIWLVGSSMLLFGIAALFMRNQVRALRRLAGAAEAFGIGRDLGAIKPEGAAEIRQAAVAFNRMQERIRRFLAQRTELLAGVSHDLRTPLTRLRLAVALLESHPALANDAEDMEGDIAEMDRMIEGYLAFARGEGTEQAQSTDLSQVLEDVANNARRTGSDIALDKPREMIMWLRPDAIRRAITNLVDNARRHARHVTLMAHRTNARSVEITVDDDGPGIPMDLRESVFRPFASGAAGGTGLGLTIARDIVRAHGGEITLEDSPSGGLRARVVLPV
jgi:two-component system osmolarity sensor histidine kinase EnvZ